MSSLELTTRKVSPYEIDINFTRNLQRIALESWTAALVGSREPAEIREAFNPNNPVLVTEAHKQYKSFARHGRLIVASASKYGPTVGYAMARNDVSPRADISPLSVGIRSYKRALAIGHNQFGLPLSNHVIAWEKHVVMLPDAPKGLGTLAVKTSLEDDFYPDQTTRAYIDDENEESIAFFTALGYEWVNDDPEPEKEVYRFGRHNDPTTQRPYSAPVKLVIDSATAILEQIQTY
jgi:hypothetical protein